MESVNTNNGGGVNPVIYYCYKMSSFILNGRLCVFDRSTMESYTKLVHRYLVAYLVSWCPAYMGMANWWSLTCGIVVDINPIEWDCYYTSPLSWTSALVSRSFSFAIRSLMSIDYTNISKYLGKATSLKPDHEPVCNFKVIMLCSTDTVRLLDPTWTFRTHSLKSG